MNEPWGWRLRVTPGEPQAAVAWGEAARRLHTRLQSMPPEQAARLHATANDQVLVVCGGAADLPWVDGIEYAAPHPLAPLLWLPTSWEPDAPLDLLGQAFAARFSRAPLLVWRAPQGVVPLDRQQPVTAQHLQQIATYWAGP